MVITQPKILIRILIKITALNYLYAYVIVKIFKNNNSSLKIEIKVTTLSPLILSPLLCIVRISFYLYILSILRVLLTVHSYSNGLEKLKLCVPNWLMRGSIYANQNGMFRRKKLYVAGPSCPQ